MLIASLLFGISASLDALLVGLSYGIRGVRIRSWHNLIISLITLLGTCLSVGLGHRLTTLLPELLAHCGGSLILICLGLYYLLKWGAAFLKNRRLHTSPQSLASPDPSACAAKSAPDFQSCSASNEAAAPGFQSCSASNEAAATGFQSCSASNEAAATGFQSCSASNEAAARCCTAQTMPRRIPHLTLPEVFTLSLTLSLNNLGLGLSASLGGLSLISAAASTLVCSVLFLSAGNRLGGSPLLQLAGKASDALSGLLLIGLGLLQLYL